MGPIVHTAVSLSIGVSAWAIGASPIAVPVALVAGVLPDLDHIIDFWDPGDEGRKRFMFRPFHAWEYFCLALLIAVGLYWESLFLVAILGYLGHIAIDQLANRVHPLAYSLAYRTSKGFRRRALTPHLFDPGRRLQQQQMPWWGLLEPSVWRWTEKLREKRKSSPN